MLTIQFKAGPLKHRLAAMKAYLNTPFTSMDPNVVHEVEDIGRKHMLNSFIAGARYGWAPVEWSTLIYSRKKIFPTSIKTAVEGAPSSLFSVGYTQRSAFLPLLDTGTLINAVGSRSSSLATRRITGRQLVLGVGVRYARKHLEGQTVTFKFSGVQAERARERLPGRLGKAMATHGKLAYPKSVKLPVRTWVKTLKKHVTAEMLAVIREDFSNFIKVEGTGSVHESLKSIRARQSKGEEMGT